jgi:hypothetical protein
LKGVDRDAACALPEYTQEAVKRSGCLLELAKVPQAPIIVTPRRIHNEPMPVR